VAGWRVRQQSPGAQQRPRHFVTLGIRQVWGELAQIGVGMRKRFHDALDLDFLLDYAYALRAVECGAHAMGACMRAVHRNHVGEYEDGHRDGDHE
jgi:hypothetical protein